MSEKIEVSKKALGDLLKIILNCPSHYLNELIVIFNLPTDNPSCLKILTGEFNSSICDCTEFQSCEKCDNKTEWLPISEIKEVNELYWIIDKNNNIGQGYLKDENVIVFDLEKTSEKFNKPIMFAEIKPPGIL